MAHEVKELGTDARGNFVRNLGWKLTSTGGRTQQRFYLGKDVEEARRRNARLQELWAVIEAESESPQAMLWTHTTLQLGMAVAGGLAVCHLHPPLPIGGEDDDRAYAQLVDRYARKYRMIAVLPADTEAYQRGKGIEEGRKQEVVRIGRDVFGEGNVLEVETRTLHEALDDYIAHVRAAFVDVETRATTGWGNTQVKEAQRLKGRHPDMPLSRLDLTAIEGMMTFWRNRPVSRRKGGEPIRVKTAEGQIKRLKNFLWWLHRQDKYRWRIPPEVDRLPVKVRETDREAQRRARPQQVETYSVAELTTLYKYALPFERVYLLLGLNCGFSIAEFGTLRLDQIFLRQRHGHDELVGYTSIPDQSWVKRVRIKTKVYGEFLLWPETVRAIEWAVERRRRQPGFGSDALLCLTDRGMPFVGQTTGGNNSTRLSKHWYSGLLNRVCKDFPDFRRLPPKCLRKTSGNMIREIAGGEIMAVFHCRGQAVRTDHLADVYSNRPFGKVFQAIEKLEERLRPMFEAVVGDPFPLEAKKGGPNISRGTIERIQALHAAGKRVSEIVREVGVSDTTVYRHVKGISKSDNA